MFKKKTKAFTLIELLVVIAIIGILTTIAIVALQSSRADSRDAKRLADIRQMQKALEMYFLENGSYPSDISSGIASGTTIYMAQIPVAPTPADGSCPSYNNTYTYASTGSSYTLDFCLGSKTGEFDAGGKRATNEGIIAYTPPVPFSCGSAFTDSRDSQQYGTVQIGTQCWMTKNMNYDNGCASVTWVNSTDVGWCGCYNNNSSYCNSNGKLYQWSAAMNGTTTAGTQGICPSGWHVPTDTEFLTLSGYLSANSQYWCNSNSTYVAKSMATTTGWTSSSEVCAVGNTPATNNASGLNAYPSGVRIGNGGFYSITTNAMMWSSTLYDANNARYIDTGNTLATFWRNWNSKYVSYPVRCIED